MSGPESIDKTARLAGLVYLVTVVTGIFSLLYVPSRISGHGDAAATVHNILASETLFRFGIAVGSIGYVAFLVVPLILYKLLGPVNRSMGALMVAFAVVSTPIDFVAIANQLDILSLLDGDKYRQLFTPEQVQARVLLLLDAYHNKVFISEIFWGLWLLPFGYLVFKSGFLPRILGIFLMLGCFGYLISAFGLMLFPHYTLPGFIMLPATFGEIGICLWLLIMGARTPARDLVYPRGGSMKTNDPYDLVVQFNECITRRDIDGLASLMTDGHTFIDKVGNVVAGKMTAIEAWRGFFKAFPDYRNTFEQWKADAGIVTISGRSHCSDQRLEGPALWRAVVADQALAEWRVYEDSPSNRQLLGL